MALATLLADRNAAQRLTTEVPARPDVRVARTREELEGAFKVLYRTYLHAELVEPNEHGMRVTPYHLLPTTTTFINEVGREIVATVSLCEDSSIGLPIESLFPDKIRELRQGGGRIAEVCSLADRRRDPERGLDAMISLTKMAIQLAMHRKVDYLLCVAHPRHGRFYKRATGMVAIGDVKACPYVCNRPAEPLLLDMNQLAENPPRLYSKYFDEKVPVEQFEVDPISIDEAFYFSRYLDDPSFRPEIIRSALQTA